MDQLRKIYRHPILESLLFFAVIFQVVTGVRLLFGKHKKSRTEKVQLYSGLYLSMFLIAHVGAVGLGRYLGLDTNFYFAAAGMNMYPAYFVFIPYYFLAVTAITLHVASIHYLRTKSVKFSLALAIAGILVAICIVLGFTDFFRWRDIPIAYQQFIELIPEF